MVDIDNAFHATNMSNNLFNWLIFALRDFSPIITTIRRKFGRFDLISVSYTFAKVKPRLNHVLGAARQSKEPHTVQAINHPTHGQ